jgi:hypothetical protein
LLQGTGTSYFLAERAWKGLQDTPKNIARKLKCKNHDTLGDPQIIELKRASLLFKRRAQHINQWTQPSTI